MHVYKYKIAKLYCGPTNPLGGHGMENIEFTHKSRFSSIT